MSAPAWARPATRTLREAQAAHEHRVRQSAADAFRRRCCPLNARELAELREVLQRGARA